ncbi:MAG: right-handed parallel beta-helix repeat-containing protein [Terriglobales bacterium]
MRIKGWILAVGMLCTATPMFAGILVVGPPACNSHYTHFTTIQSAVNAAPISGSTTIDVCPGTYPEQVQIIGKTITLKGFAYGGSDAAVITSPGGGMVSNATSNVVDDPGPVQAQVLVQNATATIEDLTLDASNNGAADPIGVFFQNASGTITRNSVLNDITNATGDQDGYGIYVESETTTGGPNPSTYAASTVTISYNIVSNFQKNGIMARETGVSVTISDNTVIGNGPWIGAAENSIEVIYGATGTINANTVGADIWAPDQFGNTGNAAAGILVGYGSENVSITTNQVANTQYGIAVTGCPGCGGVNGDGDGATISGNTISATHLYDAIDVCANNAIVTSNKINGADESGIHIDDTCGFPSETGNSISSNTISQSCAAVLEGPNTSSTVGTNTYYNVGTQLMTGSDTCTPALAPVRNGHNVPPRGASRGVRP